MKKKANKLIIKFESAINEYLESFSSLANKDSAPNFEKIEEFINKNALIIKKNKNGDYARQLRDFYQYLKTLNGNDPTIRQLDFHAGHKTINLSGKSYEAYTNLLKKTEDALTKKNPITIHSSFKDNIKNTVNSATKNTATLRENLKTIVANSSVKTVALYSLVCQSVAGMTIASNRSREQRDSRFPTINGLLDSEKLNWFRYYDQIETMLQELDKHASVIREKDKCLFFEFLEEALIRNKENELNDSSKEMIFNIVKKELSKNVPYDFNVISNSEKIYRLLFIFFKLDYNEDKYKVKTIFDLLDYYIIQLVSHCTEFKLENKQQVEHEVKKIFWVLQVNFEKYAKSLANFYGDDKFKYHFDYLKIINQNIYQWDSNNIYSFRFSLSIMGRLREYHFKENKAIGTYLDTMAKDHISQTLAFTKNKCFLLTEDEVKEAAFIAYVKNLPSKSEPLFKGLYKKVEKNSVFPDNCKHEFSTSDTVHFSIYSQQPLSRDKKDIIEKAIKNTYQRVEKLKSEVGIADKETVSNITFKLYLFKDNESYSNYGSLWGINTSGGGYAHVRTPDDEDLKFHNIRLEINTPWYESFVYQQEGDTRNTINKEGGNFRNLGHEIQHTLTYALTGQRGLNRLPSWFVEGMANYLGNEDCFKEEADYIKNFQTQGHLLSIERIIHLSYADGGDLYYFGSTLVRFMREKYSNTLKNILIKAQFGKEQNEIERIFKQWIANPEIENEFKKWVTQLINECSKINQDEPEVDVQTSYRKDLENNPSLLNLIQNKISIDFTFNDIIFTLKENELTATSYYHGKYPNRLKKIQPSDYDWFKSALAVYTARNHLILENIITEDQNKILALYFKKPIDYIENRIVEKISVVEDPELQKVFEDFALQTCLPLALKKSLSKKEFTDRLSLILDKDRLPLTCQIYLNQGNNKNLHSEAQENYLQDLQNNPLLLDMIKINGSVAITFSDTIFKLTISDISRYDKTPNRNPVPVTEGDYAWLKSALALYTIQFDLNKFSCTAEERKAIIKIFLDKDDEWLENRVVKMIQPQNYASFNPAIKEFVLNTYFDKSNKEFEDELTKELTSFKKSVSPTSTTRSNERKSLSTTTPFTDFSSSLSTSVTSSKRKKPLPNTTLFMHTPSVLSTTATSSSASHSLPTTTPSMPIPSILSTVATSSNESNSLPTTTPFMHVPSFSMTEANYPTSTVLDTTNGTEPPTLEHPSGLLWLISIILLAIPIIGTTCFFYRLNNKRYSVTPADSIKPQSTDVFPDEARIEINRDNEQPLLQVATQDIDLQQLSTSNNHSSFLRPKTEKKGNTSTETVCLDTQRTVKHN